MDQDKDKWLPTKQMATRARTGPDFPNSQQL
uniref:Uncharacterized protein n=1 Tax=Arundo donax TaxID=35708 RepID=A0A0A9F0I1_ARUDO